MPHYLIISALICYACEVFKEGLVENIPFDDPALYGYNSQILHIQPLLTWEKCNH